MINPAADTWLDRSGQRWKLRVAHVVLIGGTACGMLLFFRRVWPESFYGALVVMSSAPLSIAIVALIRCAVCGRRVALDAAAGQWLSYMAIQRACPQCGDDGTNRPVAPGELSVWFQVARELAAAERARRRGRLKIVLWVAIAAAVVAAGSWIIRGT